MVPSITDENVTSFPKLNNEQQEVLRDNTNAILVLAGAGTGKTRVLTSRIAYLIQKRHIPAKNILAVTFSNKAAREMQERVRHLLAFEDLPQSIGTFHSICAKLLRDFGEEVGFHSNFAIYDDSDQKQVLKRILKEMKLAEAHYPIAALRWEMDKAKNAALEPEEATFDETRGKIFAAYKKALKDNNALDFSDLIFYALKLLKKSSTTREYLQEKWQHILVDEYQDTNKVQRDLIYLLKGENSTLFAVGDEDQSIYGWRGADISNILNFTKDFKKASVHRLEQNYRSTQNILDVANAVINYNTERLGKKLWTQRQSGSQVTYMPCQTEKEEAEEILRRAYQATLNNNMRLSDMAILYRTNAQSRVLEETAMRLGIPYQVIGGLRFYERKEIKDTLAYLRFLNNTKDSVSFRRIVANPPKGIGEKSVEKVLSLAPTCDGDVLQAAYHSGKLLSKAIANKVGKFVAQLQIFQKIFQEEIPLASQVEKIMTDSGYLGHLRNQGTEEAQNRIDNIYEFLTSIEDFSRSRKDLTLDEFLQHISLLTDLDQMADKQDCLTLMTLHASKGLEFPGIFLAGLEEGVFPHQRSIETPDELEEERRLCYVGMTRAQKFLYLTSAASRRIYNNTQYNMPSRFIKEIPTDLLKITGKGYLASGYARAISYKEDW